MSSVGPNLPKSPARQLIAVHYPFLGMKDTTRMSAVFLALFLIGARTPALPNRATFAKRF